MISIVMPEDFTRDPDFFPDTRRKMLFSFIEWIFLGLEFYQNDKSACNCHKQICDFFQNCFPGGEHYL